MSPIDAIIYGFVQGVTEFLPVSSSGHLALLPKVLHIPDPGVAFDLAMHVGTALSILIYFKKDVVNLFSQKSRAFLSNQVIATSVSVIFILVLKFISEKFGRSPFIISGNLIFFGLLMVWADIKGTKNKTMIMEDSLQWKRAFLIGLFQSLAIFPGVSRSGATLTISRFLGLSRVESGRFSFLLSLPIIAAGFIYKFPELDSHGAIDWLSVLVGILISFLIGILTIHYFLKFIEKVGLGIFGVYRIILALAVIFAYC